mmetsp:Transcript_10646/g.18047  ORF Transcript_10646/g.18047 Transcript_10646/m.18047 type:complete len:167 (-) Transcript_10646:14-514(-)
MSWRAAECNRLHSFVQVQSLDEEELVRHHRLQLRLHPQFANLPSAFPSTSLASKFSWISSSSSMKTSCEGVAHGVGATTFLVPGETASISSLTLDVQVDLVRRSWSAVGLGLCRVSLLLCGGQLWRRRVSWLCRKIIKPRGRAPGKGISRTPSMDDTANKEEKCHQ